MELVFINKYESKCFKSYFLSFRYSWAAQLRQNEDKLCECVFSRGYSNEFFSFCSFGKYDYSKYLI